MKTKQSNCKKRAKLTRREETGKKGKENKEEEKKGVIKRIKYTRGLKNRRTED